MSGEDGPRLDVRLHPEGAKLAAEARFLEAAEWRIRLVIQAVDEHTPRDNPVRHSPRSRRIARADVGMEPGARGVRHSNGFFLRFVGEHGEDRSEDLFPRDPHLRLDANEDGRLHEIPPREIGRTAFASSEELGPFVDPGADVSLNAVVLLLRHHGPDLCVLNARRTNLPSGDLPCENALRLVETLRRNE